MSGVTDPDRRISIDPDLICDFSDLISFRHLFKSGSDLLKELPVRIIVLLIFGNKCALAKCSKLSDLFKEFFLNQEQALISGFVF